MPVEKNITLESSSIITLTCQYTTLGNLNSINVTWKKDDELLKNFSLAITGNTLYTEYTTTVINSKQMGSYSCLFEDEKEQRGTFNIKVPELHGKNKPLITYVGDSTVLVCKCQHCYPLHWTWYRSNGSIQVPIDVHTKEKYVVSGAYRNETKLKIKHLLEEDGGSYWCHAVFQLGESEEQLELVVLSFLVPLKPFLAIIAEAVVLVAVILLCEVYTQKKKKHPDEGKEFEQIEQLKSDDSNGIENNAPRQRKNCRSLESYLMEQILMCTRGHVRCASSQRFTIRARPSEGSLTPQTAAPSSAHRDPRRRRCACPSSTCGAPGAAPAPVDARLRPAQPASSPFKGGHRLLHHLIGKQGGERHGKIQVQVPG
ncbi:Embigin [Fukomys damarensis]|uniref:Embigin n=1 Tax=Fukomys damarensis TaxID=885580 RepID=A0A091CYE7_FUKDA|nr:Embigin [Fukomys damarensis]